METTTPLRSRVGVLDGLRGIAIVLVVLSHGWQLWPTEWIDARDWVRPVFRSGNTAVTVFLVAGGFLTHRALSRAGDLRGMRPDTALLRRVLRVGPSLWLMLLVLCVVWALDGTLVGSEYDNGPSFLHVLTYTWNWYVQDNLVNSRPEFGHLWYLSVDMQAFVVMAGLMYVLRRRPLGLVCATTALLLLLTWWRFHVADIEFVFQVLVRTTARMDPFVAGVLASAVVTLLSRTRLDPLVLRLVAGATAVALVPLVWYAAVDERFLGWGVALLEVDLALLFGAVALGARTPRPLDARVLRFLGRNSLLVYIWHYPVFVFVQRHAEDWDWQAKALVGLAGTVVLSMAAHWLLERHVTSMLRSPRWRALDDGLPTAAARLARRGAHRALPATRRTSR